MTARDVPMRRDYSNVIYSSFSKTTSKLLTNFKIYPKEGWASNIPEKSINMIKEALKCMPEHPQVYNNV